MASNPSSLLLLRRDLGDLVEYALASCGCGWEMTDAGDQAPWVVGVRRDERVRNVALHVAIESTWELAPHTQRCEL